MFEDARGDLWEIRLRLPDLARLRLDGCLDLNAVANVDDGLRDWLFGRSLKPLLRAAWMLVASGRIGFAEWVDRMDAPAVQRLQQAMARALADFFRNGSGASRLRPRRTGKARGSSGRDGNLLRSRASVSTSPSGSLRGPCARSGGSSASLPRGTCPRSSAASRSATRNGPTLPRSILTGR